jgi:hypothetical protein
VREFDKGAAVSRAGPIGRFQSSGGYAFRAEDNSILALVSSGPGSTGNVRDDRHRGLALRPLCHHEPALIALQSIGCEIVRVCAAACAELAQLPGNI